MSHDPFDALLAKVPDAQKTGPGKALARCPAHDDKRRSLSVKRGEDGRVLLHCFAGCATEAILAARGLSMADLFPDPPEADKGRTTSRPKPAPRPHTAKTYATPEEAIASIARQVGGTPVKSWTYHNADGSE